MTRLPQVTPRKLLAALQRGQARLSREEFLKLL
jgi:hypothetical protein